MRKVAIGNNIGIAGVAKTAPDLQISYPVNFFTKLSSEILHANEKEGKKRTYLQAQI